LELSFSFVIVLVFVNQNEILLLTKIFVFVNRKTTDCNTDRKYTINQAAAMLAVTSFGD